MSSTSIRQDSQKTQESAYFGSAILAVGKFSSVIFTLAIHLILIRSFSKDDFGAFSYAMSAVSVLSILVSLGMEQTVSRFASLYDEQGDNPRLSGLVLFYTAVVVSLGCASTAIFTLCVQSVESIARVDTTTALTLAALCVLGPLQAFDTMLMNLFATFARPKAVFVRRYVLAPVLRVVAVLTVVFTSHNITHVAIGYVLGSVIGIVVYGPVAWRMMREHGMFNRSNSAVFDVPRWLSYTAGSLCSDLLIVLLFFSDVFMVGAIGDSQDVAALQAVGPIANGGLVVFYALIPIFLPSVTRLFHQRAFRKAEETYSQSTAWIVIFTLPVTIMTIGFAHTVNSTLFPSNYASSAAILAVAAAAQFFIASFGLTGLLLKAQSKLWLLAGANALVALLNIAANWFLIHVYGPLGAAVGSLVAVCLLSLMKVFLVRSQLSLNVLTAPVLKALLLASIAVCVAALIQYATSPPFVVCLGIGAALSLVALRLSKPFLRVGEVFPSLARKPFVRYFI